MTALQLLLLLGRDGPPDLTDESAREEATAHPDAAVDAPAVNKDVAFLERPLPGHYVGVDRVDQGAVEVKYEGAHMHHSGMVLLSGHRGVSHVGDQPRTPRHPR